MTIQELDSVISELSAEIIRREAIISTIEIKAETLKASPAIHTSNKGLKYPAMTIKGYYLYDGISIPFSHYFYINVPKQNELVSACMTRIKQVLQNDLDETLRKERYMAQNHRHNLFREEKEQQIKAEIERKRLERLAESEKYRSPLNNAVISIFGHKLGSANKWVKRIIANPSDEKAKRKIEKLKKIRGI